MLAPVLLVTTAVGQGPPPQPTVPVTVTITSVTSLSGGDVFSGAPDFFARVNIDNTWLPDSSRIDNTASITPNWTFTKDVRRVGPLVPIRIEIKDFDSPLPPEDVDVDPSSCPPEIITGGGCATLTIGRTAVDYKGIDISLDRETGAVSPVDPTGDASSPTACTTGTEGQTAMVCFTVSLGTPNPGTLVVTKTADTNDGDCSLSDCSLREAVTAARDDDTVLLNSLGQPYRLTFRRWVDGVSPIPDFDEPGHLKITRQNLKIRGPANGAGVVIEQTSDARVFDVHSGASVTMMNLTIRGGVARNNSTALPGHVHGGGIHNHGIVNLVNVTLTDNHAPATPAETSLGGGGAIYNAGVMTLSHVTIAGNDAAQLAGGLSGTAATVVNTLIANNLGPDGPDAGSDPDPVNCTGSPTDVGGNKQFPGNSCPFAGTSLPASPIGALAPDYTFWLLPGSPAIDGGIDIGGVTDDQAGTPRPLDGNGDGSARFDAGATEYDPQGLGVIHQPLNSATGQPGPVTLTFDNVTTPGTSTLTVSTTGPARPGGYRAGTPALYYDLQTAAAFTGGVKVCIDYAGAAFANEAGLRLLHHTAGSWQDETVSLDTDANTICARSTSFSVFAVLQANRAPAASIAVPAGGYRLNEGGSVVLQGSGSDPDGDPLTFEWSPAAELNDPTLATPTFSPRDEGTRVYSLVVRDGDASSAPATTAVRVDNVPPTMTLTLPVEGTAYRVGSAVEAHASFTDPGADDVHTCKVVWDDGTAPQAGNVTESNGGGSCAAVRTFTSAGVYTLELTIDDGDGGAATASAMVVVYDPAAGRVVGGGHIVSPAGAYRPNPSWSGPVVFAFTAQYLGSVPVGATAAQLPGGARFASTSLEWLVVAGFKAQFRGTGQINGRGDYGFLLTAYDGQRPGGGGSDRFRLKIWNRSGGAVVYDNVLDPTATDDIDRAKPQPVGFATTIAILPF